MQITSRKGFTLIELLIVVAIIGILASVILIGLGPSQRAGRDARRIADLRQVQTGLELYFQRNGQYPGANATPMPWSGDNSLSAALVGAGLGITSVPIDPSVPASGHYRYVRTSANQYILGAKFEDVNNKAMSSSLGANVAAANAPKIGAETCGVDIFCMGN
jgi:prepilin-type N-terminal cleavage/methylation domain-containing protein